MILQYRSLRTYKYQLVTDYSLGISIKPNIAIDTGYIALNLDGTLTIKKGYAWDGPSGPTIDTKSFMRGALVHDALYQLMRMSELDVNAYLKEADLILKRLCLQDGMFWFRAWYVHVALSLFGKKNAMPQARESEKVIELSL